MGDEIEIPVIEHATEHTQEHAVDLAHTERLTRLEERHQQQVEEQSRQLMDLRGELASMIETSNGARNEEIAALRREISDLSEKMNRVQEDVITVPEAAGEVAELEVPEIEESPAPPEKERRGLRARRKKRKGAR